MGIKNILGSLSPAYGAISGEGVFGKLVDSGVGGVLPQLLSEERKKEERDKEEARLAKGMKKGGKVKKMAKGGAVKSSASKRADGCAQRGKTKGKFV